MRMALERFSCSRLESISVTNWLTLSPFCRAMASSSSINSGSSEMLVEWRVAVKAEFFEHQFFLRKASIETTVAMPPEAFFGSSASSSSAKRLPAASSGSSALLKLRPNLA